ncbi:hypothetical protein ACHAW6_013234 [Cyclotella cf. meneghiniana]
MLMSSSYTAAPDEPDSLDPTWSFADSGKTRPLSRDLSPNSTDEVFNSVSHLSGAMLSLLGTTLLVSGASARGDVWKVVAFSIYGACLVGMFVCSVLHHSISSSQKVEAQLRMLDYLAIYPLIAGTFTPLCLVFLHDTVIGWSFFGVAWFFALMGMYLTATLGPDRIPKWFSMTMYITMGWIGAFLMFWLLSYIKLGGLALFIVGGLWYTIGGYIYTTERPNPYPGVFGFHEIWHVMVILGAGFHFAVMFFYVLPWEG